MKITLERILSAFNGVMENELTHLEKEILEITCKGLGWTYKLNKYGEIKFNQD